MVILDTNVVSEVLRPRPSTAVLGWIAKQPPGALHLTTISEAELLYGVALLPEGRRRSDFARVVQDAIDGFEGRILPFDRSAAARYPEIAAGRKALGLAADTADMQIAAIAAVHSATLATRNVKDFAGSHATVVNPFD